jgi:hypothetical protein
MNYQPFFDMNVLISDSSLTLVSIVAAFLMFPYLFAFVYLSYRFCFPKKSTFDSEGF